MTTLQDKIVWITGATSGIGEQLVYECAKEGAKIVLSARRAEEMERVAKTANLTADRYLIVPLDLADNRDYSSQVKAVLDKFGQVDVLINNGGISQRSLAKETKLEVDRELMEVNYFGTISLSKAVLPYMLTRKSGMLVSVSSAVGKFGSPWRSGYSASKHALHGFFDSLRAECHDEGLKVLIVCPGFVSTNITMNALTASGAPLRSMDSATGNGLSSAYTAKRMVMAIKRGKREIVIGGFKENLGVWMMRHFPGIFAIMIRKMAVR
ncbi:MAG: short-chain dehydrogenase/reductase [Bacteroidetes bacterium]|nr:short-chain dehydrogenase/reductase [Bacteroidota bacterium]